MFERDLFELKATISDALKSIQGLKKNYVGLQQYENTAKLRDIEKHLEIAEKAFFHIDNPIPSPILKPQGELFFKELFAYANLNCWDIPDNFTDAFKARKAKMNGEIEFKDQSTKRIVWLNQKLAEEENRVIEFLNFLNYFINVKGVRETLNELSTLNITISFFTNNDKYVYPNTNFDIRRPFYRLKLPATDLLNSSINYYGTNKTGNVSENNFLRLLPLNFSDEKICFLFFILANEGLLAWEDFLNIDGVTLDLDVRYQFSTSN